MGRFIVIDRTADEEFLARLLDDGKNTIDVLIIDNNNQRENINKLTDIKSVYTVEDIDTIEHVGDIDFDIIKKCKEAQLHVENGLTRFENDYNTKKYKYYMTLSFWYKLFQSKQYYAVIIKQTNHGLLYDGILPEIAKIYNVPCYFIEPLACKCSYIRNINDNRIIYIKNKRKISNIMEYLKRDGSDVLNFDFDCGLEGDGLKKRIIRFLYSIGGYLLCRWGALLKNGFKPIQTASSGFYHSYSDELESYFKHGKTGHYLKVLECKYIPEKKEKYIFFPLQFEPEASMQVRINIESQLFMVKILSEVLPKGWKIYVKDHPHQYKLNNNLFWYQIYHSDLFKTKKFYDILASIDNVRIIEAATSGNLLMKNSIAVVSPVGSTLLEAIANGKTAVLFSDIHPLINCEGVLRINSLTTARAVMEKLASGYTGNYDNVLEVLNKSILLTEEDKNANVEQILIDIKNFHVRNLDNIK